MKKSSDFVLYLEISMKMQNKNMAVLREFVLYINTTEPILLHNRGRWTIIIEGKNYTREVQCLYAKTFQKLFKYRHKVFWLTS